MNAKLGCVLLVFVLSLSRTGQACIWDAKTLVEEQKAHPTLADAILHPKVEVPDVAGLKKHLQELQANPHTNDPTWWNDVAGTYLRAAQPADAVKILEPITNRFANDYGVHANLGTAYHLLGRYKEAEREIRRDTEINTNAHFGLEKYHLALLQYLSRDANYRFRHVYVDEFSFPFVQGSPQIHLMWKSDIKWFADHQIDQKEAKFEEDNLNEFLRTHPGRGPDSYRTTYLQNLVMHDEPPQYRQTWDLSKDPNLEQGVIYMATLNPKEPACWVMLGIVAEYQKDYNLAATAFRRALELDSTQEIFIQSHIGLIDEQLEGLAKHHREQQALAEKDKARAKSD